jgi:predicted dehydrogenase
MKIFSIPILVFLSIFCSRDIQGQENKPVRLAIAGLSHSHVQPLLRNMKSSWFEVVGIYEPNSELANRYSQTYGFNKSLIYNSLDEMLDRTKPEGVLTFTSIFDHLGVVKACAPRGIHVMVEKPLAVSTRHAKEIKALADKYNIQVLTNYETSWYPSNHKVYEMLANRDLGELHRVMVYDGHQGPKEIKVNSEFLEWLTDPILNGGGAVDDFGCYGADLITWMLKGEKPLSVYAVLKQYKPDVYPRVDDDATIVLNYKSLTGVIYASWNWPFNRKDMHLYGSTGYVYADDSQNIRYRLSEKDQEKSVKLPLIQPPLDNPFTYFSSVIRGNVKIEENDLSSLKTNMTVVEILEAARTSSRTGNAVKLEKSPDSSIRNNK